jgi:REP element-mobilizing transposase RayT
MPSHHPRWTRKSRTLVEVSTQTFQRRFFLKPTPEIREIIIGVIGRAQHIYQMEICLLVFMSSHYHMLILPKDPEHMARFMNFVNGQIAKKVLERIPWTGKFWHKPFDPILVTDEPKAQRARFRYLLSHGVKEGLVERPEQWIGVNGVKAWLEGEPLTGHWFDKTQESRAKRKASNRGRKFGPMAFATPVEIVFTLLPCWKAEGLSLAEIRREIRAMIEEIVSAYRLSRLLAGRPKVAGPAAVLAKPWDFEPEEKPKRGPRPLFHFRSKEVYEQWRAEYGDFLAAYRRASAELRSGGKVVKFPARCFPPAGPLTRDGSVGIAA